MTPHEFQQRYHTYSTSVAQAAIAEAEKANTEGIDGDRAVAVNFWVAWGLMLQSAYDYIREIGVEVSTEA